ncbi:phage tail tape measure protein [Agathobaculum massiliense]|uniref:hypothetical protein n=1 Tax=Agathobaculum massiliense TaxID=3014267 RepID=UPI000D1E7B28|nr:hypothetical protein [Agathobaculum massiliense]
MAKNKVINTVLNLRDNMSGGLLKAAQNAKKSGAKIDDSMIQSTRKVIAFKNKAVSAMQEFAKKSALAAGAAVGGLAAAFVALDGATEEYRVAQGKLNTAFDAAGFSADAARKSYRNFYAILGDTDTAAEASQLLAKLAQNERDVGTWTRIAAGVSGTFGDSLPIEGLIEAANETAKVGQVTGTLADALNWAGILEDDFNERLSTCGSEAGRNKLIMDTLARTYEGAAEAFYQNNRQVVDARRNQATLSEITAKLGDASATAKNKLWEMLGAQADGSIRAGSALEWLTEKAAAFSGWVAGLDMDGLAAQFDQRFAGAIERAGDAIAWCKENGDLLIGGLKLLAGAFVLVKVGQFNSSLKNGISTIGGFIGTIAGMTTATTAQAAATGTATAAQRGLNAAFKANPIGFVITLVEGLIAVGVLLYKNWDTLTKWAGRLWDTVKKAFGGIRDAIVGAFDSAKDAVGSFFSWLDDKIESVPLLGQLYKGAKGIGSSFLNWLDGATRIQPRGNALGTSYWRGGLTRVNERGGEIISLPNGTQIIPHDVSVRRAGGPQVTVNVTVAGNVIGNRQYADELGETIVRNIIRAWDNV